MNKEFMGSYYDLKYADTFLPLAMESNEECRKLQEEIMDLEGRTEAVMRGAGEESLRLHGELFVAVGKLEELIMRLAYLQGAEDREKMLE